MKLQFLLLPGGNVGIGTYTIGTDKLRVKGTVHANMWATGGADYAEYFESSNGSAIPTGTTVVLTKDGKIRPAKKGEDPIGIVTANSAIVGNSYREWPKKYLRDEFGNLIMEEYEEETDVLDENDNPVLVETGELSTKKRPKLNPDYNESKEYILREDRPEWNCVGLLGQLHMRKGQPTGKIWVKIRKTSDKVELWLVK